MTPRSWRYHDPEHAINHTRYTPPPLVSHQSRDPGSASGWWRSHEPGINRHNIRDHFPPSGCGRAGRDGNEQTFAKIEVSQSWKRPLPPCLKYLLPLSHLRHYAKLALTPRYLNVKFQPGEGPRRGLLRDYKPSDGTF